MILLGQSFQRRESFRTYNNNSDNHDHYNQQQRADHGENFVPGSEDAPNLAPQPLDHFKRGYQERTNQRDRDLHNHGSNDGGQSGNNNNINNRGNNNNDGGGNNNNNNSAGGGPRHDSSPRYNNSRVEGNNKGGEERPMPPRYSGVANGSYNGGGRGHGGTPDRNSNYGGGGNRGRGDGGDDYPRRGRGERERSFDGGRGRGGRGRGGGRGRDGGYPYRGGDSGGYRGGGGRGDHRRPFHGDRDDRGGGRGGGQQIIMGLDIQALVDRLVRPGCDVFRELGVTRQSHMAVFQSGKAVTAIISNLARRRNLRIANAVWEWIDYIGIEKNTFHYNSMISACEKVRDYNKALRLLDEMKEKKVPKNEVTYVH